MKNISYPHLYSAPAVYSLCLLFVVFFCSTKVELMVFLPRMLLQRSLGSELANTRVTSYFNGGHFAGCLFKMKAVISRFRLLRKNALNIKVQCLAEMCDMMT